MRSVSLRACHLRKNGRHRSTQRNTAPLKIQAGIWASWRRLRGPSVPVRDSCSARPHAAGPPPSSASTQPLPRPRPRVRLVPSPQAHSPCAEHDDAACRPRGGRGRTLHPQRPPEARAKEGHAQGHCGKREGRGRGGVGGTSSSLPVHPGLTRRHGQRWDLQVGWRHGDTEEGGGRSIYPL